MRSAFALIACLALGPVACADPPLPRPPQPKTLAATKPAEEPLPTSDLVPVLADDPSLGSRLARVTIVLFSDFQCPYCARVGPVVAKLRETYGDDLRVVWKDNPLK